MNPMVTRCPKCSTSFRITSTQLETAKGAVRCGSCLHVFKALDHLVSPAVSNSTHTTTASVKPITSKVATPDTAKIADKKVTDIKSTLSQPTKPNNDLQKPIAAGLQKSGESSVAKISSATSSTKTASTHSTPSSSSAKVSPITKSTSAAAPTAIRKPSTPETNAAKTSTKPAASLPTKSLIDPLTHKAPPTKTTAEKTASPKAAPKKVVIDKAKILEDEEDLLISDDMDKKSEKSSAYEFDGFLDMDLNPVQNVSLFEREIRYQAPADDKPSADESWAENLLEEEEALEREPKNLREKISSSTTTPIVTAAMIAARKQQEDAEHHKAYEAHDSHYASHAEEIDENAYPPLFSLISESSNSAKSEDELFSEAFKKATNPAAESSANTQGASQDFSALFSEPSNDNDSESNSNGAKRNGKSQYKIRMADSSRTSLLMNIIPAPVEMTAKRVRNWYHQKLWPSLAILCSVILIFQIAYFKFDYFSRVEPYRSVYAALCPVFGCKLPTLVDTKQIVTYNLVVRQHPDIDKALMVDAVILNKAPFEQPFPDIILSFSTINNTPVAARRFTAKEYLAGELAGKDVMESNVPVHLKLELTDPGPEAVNYTTNIP